MNCKATETLLSAYIDGELSGREMLAVRQHINECTNCATEIEVVRQLKAALISLPDQECDPGFEDRLVMAVIGERKAQTNRLRFAFAGGFAFVGAFVIATAFMQSSNAQAVESSNQVARSSFELERDQAYLAGSDPLAGNSVVLTSSYGLR